MENQMKNEQITENKHSVRPLSHRVAAWIAIVLLVGMYTATLISAISGGGSTSELFMMSLGATVVLPGILWFYIRFWNFSSGRDRETFRENYEMAARAEAKNPENTEDSDKENDIAGGEDK